MLPEDPGTLLSKYGVGRGGDHCDGPADFGEAEVVERRQAEVPPSQRVDQGVHWGPEPYATADDEGGGDSGRGDRPRRRTTLRTSWMELKKDGDWKHGD